MRNYIGSDVFAGGCFFFNMLVELSGQSESMSRRIRKGFAEGKLTATARVVHRGRSIGLVECDVVNGGGKPVARASSTCSVLRGEAAKGR